MAVTALLKFTQGPSIGGDGLALKGVPITPVVVENVDNTNIQSWTVDLVYTPPGGTPAPAAPLADDPGGATPLAVFPPGTVPGCYRVVLTVYDQAGYSGNSDVDIRNFAVPEPRHGFIFPPYQQLPPKLPPLGSGIVGEKPDELNFDGQPFGWDGDGEDGLLLHFLRAMAEQSGSGFSWKTIPEGTTVVIPEGRQMIVSGGFTNNGELILEGELALIPSDFWPIE